METKKIIAAAIAGTSAMTLFSYLISADKKKNLKEPEHIKEVIEDVKPSIDNEKSALAAWGTHYGVGLAFSSIFSQIWEKTPVKPGLLSGAFLGALSGIAGIMSWSEAFKLDPDTNAKNFKEYYAHLMASHIIFGIGAAAGYKLMEKEKISDKIRRQIGVSLN